MMMQQMRQVPPSAENEKYFETIARLPMMSDEELNTYINTGFGALALTEISRRNRFEMQKKAADAAKQGGNTIADAEIQKRMQSKMAERMAGDDRMGLNNIVAQAEQGGLEFGQPTQGMAGGGIVAFANGKYPVKEDRSGFGETFGFEPGGVLDIMGRVPGELGEMLSAPFEFFSRRSPTERKQEEMEDQLRKLENKEATLALRGLELDPESKIALKGLRTTLGMDTGPKGKIDTSRLFPQEDVDKEKARVAGAGTAQKPSAQQAGIQSLFTTDPAKILEERKKLMAAQGIGEFGADVQKMLGESEAKVMDRLSGAKLAKGAAQAAKAVGGRGRERKTGLEALAAGVAGFAEGAADVADRELEAQTKFDEFRMKQAMAKDAYDRGEVGKAQELAMSAQRDQRDYNLKKEELDITRTFRDAQLAAAKFKSGKFDLGDVSSAAKNLADIQERMINLDPEDPQDAAAIAAYQQAMDMLRGGIGLAFSATGGNIQDIK